MQFIDSHIHLQDYKTKNTQQIIAELQQCNFAKVICVSTKPDDFAKVASFADAAPKLIIPAFGIHPWYTNDAPSDWENSIWHFLRLYPQSIIGECGIDRLKGADIEQQKIVLQNHIKLADEFKRPLNIHLVHGEDILAQMFKYLPEKFLLHSFSGSIQFLQSALCHGAYISLNPSILRRSDAHDIIRAIPDDRILSESDAPFQKDFTEIPDFIKQISAVKNTSYQKTAEQIIKNFQEFIDYSN